MKKRNILWLLYVLLGLLVIGTIVCMVVLGSHTNNRVDGVYLEQLKEGLKVYIPIETSDETISAPDSFEKTEESPIPETEEIETDETVIPEPTETETERSETILSESDKTEMETEMPGADTTVPETEPVKVSDVSLDFQSMWEINPDICAWIEIEGTKVDYPVLQNPEDDNKYLNTAVDGSYYIGGSLFTQATYNSNDFNDPVTVIYGHTMRAGTLFGQLQSTYSSAAGFADHSEIKLYLPNEVRYYTVFAAVPYSNMHILAAYDFTKEYWYHNFMDSVLNTRGFGVQIHESIIPEPGDRILILSTCLNEDSTRRFLVMAIYQDDMK